MKRALLWLKMHFRRVLKMDICGFTELDIFSKPSVSDSKKSVW